MLNNNNINNNVKLPYAGILRTLFISLPAIFLLVSGCSSGGAFHSNSSKSGRTHGIYLTMHVTDNKARVVDLTLDYDGNLMVIAGRQVITSETGYTASLTDEEIIQLTDMLKSAGWFNSNIKSNSLNDDKDKHTKFKINLNYPDGYNKFTLYTESGPAFDIYDMLMEIALRKKYQESLKETAVNPHN